MPRHFPSSHHAQRTGAHAARTGARLFVYSLCTRETSAWPVSTIGSVSDYEGPLDRAHQEVAGSSPVLVNLFSLCAKRTSPSRRHRGTLEARNGRLAQLVVCLTTKVHWTEHIRRLRVRAPCWSFFVFGLNPWQINFFVSNQAWSSQKWPKSVHGPVACLLSFVPAGVSVVRLSNLCRSMNGSQLAQTSPGGGPG